MSTRVTALEFKGGFTRRYLDLKVDAKGDFTQTERTATFPQPKDAADSAINTKIEGWEIPQELRAIVQITPENAPIVVAAVGGQDEVDQRILVPSIRSLVRNVYGGSITVKELNDKGALVDVTRPTRVLDTIENRTILEQAILERAQIDGRRAGVDIKEIRLGESAIPPELLLARQREQLAGQLRAAYIQEQTAQEQRQKTEQARATADQQRDIVTAQTAVKVACSRRIAARRKATPSACYLEEQAAGQTAQAEVLGKDSVLKLQQLKLFLELLGRPSRARRQSQAAASLCRGRRRRSRRRGGDIRLVPEADRSRAGEPVEMKKAAEPSAPPLSFKRPRKAAARAREKRRRSFLRSAAAPGRRRRGRSPAGSCRRRERRRAARPAAPCRRCRARA